MKRRRSDHRTRRSPSQIRRSRLERLENRHLLAVVFADSFEAGGGTGDWAGYWVEDSQNDWFRSTQRATDGGFSAEVDGSALFHVELDVVVDALIDKIFPAAHQRPVLLASVHDRLADPDPGGQLPTSEPVVGEVDRGVGGCAVPKLSHCEFFVLPVAPGKTSQSNNVQR